LTKAPHLCHEEHKNGGIMDLGTVKDFAVSIRKLATDNDAKKEHIVTEEATKTALVMPFLQVLGYNVFDPSEVVPEFTADRGIKKGEKVDYAIKINNNSTILVEVKTANSGLQFKTENQLIRYCDAVKPPFAILTNGIEYQFFYAPEKGNQMDATPFLSVRIVPRISDQDIADLKRFHKSCFDAEKIRKRATELKYTGEVLKYLKDQFKSPDESFISLIIKKTSYHKFVTKKTIESFSSIVRDVLKQCLSETTPDQNESIVLVPRLFDQTQSRIDKKGPAVIWKEEDLRAAYKDLSEENRKLSDRLLEILDFAVNKQIFMTWKGVLPTFKIKGKNNEAIAIIYQNKFIQIYLSEKYLQILEN
jgi:predicted type IV restriction endonuclease